ncbi:MAG: DUF1836 domain-containing protein [Lachnospiraceae bacterium]|nr:DUF1836 domain-containing protein [Lachnospiraceae bacterium]
MTLDKDNLLSSILESLDRIHHIKLEDIPNIELYMDQVTTFMEHNLKSSLRNPEDKILTKTMINNYAKNDLLPPPVKKKYSREHIIMLIFIYYYKGILSINDIQALLGPLTEKYFQGEGDINLGAIYEEVFSLEKAQVDAMKEDVVTKFEMAHTLFEDAKEEDKETLQMFSFICLLSFDVYLKKLMIEKMLDNYVTAKEGQVAVKEKKSKEK